MLRLSEYNDLLSEAVIRLKLSSIYDILFSGNDDEVASVLSSRPELAESVLATRREIRSIAEGVNERVANAVVNYMLLKAGGFTIPKTLEMELATILPGVYIVSSEKVLITRPGEAVGQDVSVDAGYMDKAIERLVSVGNKSLVISGVVFDTIDYNYIYSKFFDTKLAEHAFLKKLLEACASKEIPVVGEKVYREGNAIVAEVDVDIKKLIQNRYRTEIPGSLKIRMKTTAGSKRSDLIAEYSDGSTLNASYGYEIEYVESHIEDITGRLLSNVVNSYEIVKQAKEVAESRGFEWQVNVNNSAAVKKTVVDGTEVTVKVSYMVSNFREIKVSLEAPSTSAMYDFMQKLASSLGGKIYENEDKVEYVLYHEMNRETALSSLELADKIIAKLSGETKGEQSQVNDEVLLGALLLKASNPETYQYVFESLNTTFLEALNTVFRKLKPDIAETEIMAMYKNPPEILRTLSDSVDVRNDGEPLLLGKTIDEYLSPFRVDKRTVVSVKRAVVEAYISSNREASLSSTLLMRGVQITPDLVRKLISYGDIVPAVVLGQEYEGTPIWHHLTSNEKLAVAIKILKRADFADALLRADFLTPDDGKIIAKTLCTIRSSECTRVAFEDLRDELLIPRHALLKHVEDHDYIDTGAYLIRIYEYEPKTDTYTFKVRYKASDKEVELKAKNIRDVLRRVVEDEELQTA